MKRYTHVWGAAVLIAAAAMLLTVLSATAQQRWGPQGCPPVGGPVRPQPVHEWRALADDPDHVYLFRDNVQIGGWCYSAQYFREFDAAARAWRPAIEAAAPVPVPPQPQILAVPEPIAEPRPFVAGDGPNFGIDLERMQAARAGHRYHLNGKEVGRAEAFDAVGAELPDDADALRLTWIGPADVGERIRQDLDAAAGWKGKVSLQSYPTADEPILKGLGFVPGLAVQAAAGKPLWYCAQYQGAEDLAGGLLLADARRKDPAWDPAHWPALNVPPKLPVPVPAPVLPSIDVGAWLKQNWLILAAIAAAFFLFRQKGKVQT